MDRDASILLTGFMGTGKSAVGRRVAARLGRPFVDMDAEIEKRAGRTIAAIFAEDGEPAFRALERALARELASRSGLVVAAGGGAVLDPRNVADFMRAGLLVCLDARPEVILARLAGERHRPLLETADREQRLRELLARRAACYAALPVHVDTSDLTPDAVADAVLTRFEEAVRGT